MKTHRIDCFGRTDKSGNPAIVVESSTLVEEQRQAFARGQDAGATVFVETNASGEVQLDYYYPHARSPLCLHATLAAAAVLFERDPGMERIRFVTSVHRQILHVERADECIFIGVKAQPCASLNADVTETARLLGAQEADLIGIRGPASVGSAKLLVEVADESVLHGLNPDLAGIAAWSRKYGVSGIYAYCRVRDDLYAGRNFNHLEPRFEDAATGVAAGALALSLARSVTLMQGDRLGQPCTLVARYLDGAVQVGGRAVRAASGRPLAI
ncbi:PhzF family phenazine biosynthesis protein [Trinickia sp. NRRL B-1857]|uniref:PhzF family phenazine biosynthesis protein n=1 Tax=Trinickia sp. NRRL B-1857 TaxID=3162879 RepID=UPI003D29DD11